MKFEDLMRRIAEHLRQMEGADAAEKMQARKDFLREVEAEVRNLCNACVLTCACRDKGIAA